MISHRQFTKIVKDIRKTYGKSIKLVRYPKKDWYGIYLTDSAEEGSDEYYRLMDVTGSVSTKYFEDDNGNIYPCHFSASIDIVADEKCNIPNIKTIKIHKLL